MKTYMVYMMDFSYGKNSPYISSPIYYDGINVVRNNVPVSLSYSRNAKCWLGFSKDGKITYVAKEC